MQQKAYPIPRLPVLSRGTFSGKAEAAVPCLLSLPQTCFTTSGRASILLGLEALGVGAGDRVLLPTYHCPTMVAPVVHLHGEPVFYPINSAGGPSMAWLESQDLRGVQVMLVAHLFGLPQPMESVREWCNERGIALLEDCAHAMFGRSGSRPIGAWGDVAIGSLTKFLPMNTGGCLVMNRRLTAPKLAAPSASAAARVVVDAVELSACHGRLPALNGLVTGTLAAFRGIRRVDLPGERSGSTDTLPKADAMSMAAIDAPLAHQRLPAPGQWLARLVRRSRIVELRRARYEQLSRRLSGHEGMYPLMPVLPADCAPYVFPLWVAEPDPGYATLRAMRMPVSRWDWLWPTVARIDDDHGVQWSHHVLQLACHQELSDANIDALVNTLLQLYGSRSPTPRPVSSTPLQQQQSQLTEMTRL